MSYFFNIGLMSIINEPCSRRIVPFHDILVIKRAERRNKRVSPFGVALAFGAGGDHLVDQAPVPGFLRGHEVVTV